MSLIAAAVRERKAERARLLDAVARRLRWWPGVSSDVLRQRLGWLDLGATETVLRELAEAGRAHERGDVWFAGPAEEVTDHALTTTATGADTGRAPGPAEDLEARSSAAPGVVTVPDLETVGVPSGTSPPEGAHPHPDSPGSSGREESGKRPAPEAVETRVEPSGSVEGERASSLDTGAAAVPDLPAMPESEEPQRGAGGESLGGAAPVPGALAGARSEEPIDGGAPVDAERVRSRGQHPAGQPDVCWRRRPPRAGRGARSRPPPHTEQELTTRARLVRLVQERPGVTLAEAAEVLGKTPERIRQIVRAEPDLGATDATPWHARQVFLVTHEAPPPSSPSPDDGALGGISAPPASGEDQVIPTCGGCGLRHEGECPRGLAEELQRTRAALADIRVALGADLTDDLPSAAARAAAEVERLRDAIETWRAGAKRDSERLEVARGELADLRLALGLGPDDDLYKGARSLREALATAVDERDEAREQRKYNDDARENMITSDQRCLDERRALIEGAHKVLEEAGVRPWIELPYRVQMLVKERDAAREEAARLQAALAEALEERNTAGADLAAALATIDTLRAERDAALGEPAPSEGRNAAKEDGWTAPGWLAELLDLDDGEPVTRENVESVFGSVVNPLREALPGHSICELGDRGAAAIRDMKRVETELATACLARDQARESRDQAEADAERLRSSRAGFSPRERAAVARILGHLRGTGHGPGTPLVDVLEALLGVEVARG